MIQRIKKKLEETIRDKKSVLLFTGGKESTLLLDIFKDVCINAVFIDTSYHFNDIMDYVKNYAQKIEIVRNNDASADPASDMSECCGQRKAKVLKEYLERVNAQYLIVPFRDEEKDNGIEDSYLKGIDNIKVIRPLSDLTERDVWVNIKENRLSFSRIYNKGYKIVDCKYCTTRHGRRKHGEVVKIEAMDKETEEKLKALGYM